MEFTFGDGTRKLWPQDVQYNSADTVSYTHLTKYRAIFGGREQIKYKNTIFERIDEQKLGR